MAAQHKVAGAMLGNRYRLISQIGAGGCARVYTAKDTETGRTCAIKQMHPNPFPAHRARTRFNREAAFLKRMQHPCIPKNLNFISDSEQPYIVMEHAAGSTLDSSMEQYELGDIVRLMIEILEILEHVHNRGVIHRDIKPQNLMENSGHITALLDFGIALCEDNQVSTDIFQHLPKNQRSRNITKNGIVVGTTDYASPEQVLGNPVGPQSDIYNLGVMFYQLACQALPFQAELDLAVALKHVREVPLPPSEINPAISVYLEDIIMIALEKRPENRFCSAAEMAAILRAISPDLVCA